MTDAEKETVIQYDRESDAMRIYTSDPAMMARLSRLAAYKLTRERRNGGKIVSLEFVADKHLLTLRAKRPASNMTDEQKRVARERLERINRERKAQNQF